MRALFALPVLAAAALAAADPPAPLAGSDTILPRSVPGYELRALDVRKQVLFNVEGKRVQVSVPIFFYFPVAPPAEALPLLRRACEGLAGLERKPEWTAAELRAVIADLDAGIRALERPAPKP